MYGDNKGFSEVIVPNPALYRDQVKDVIPRPKRNPLSVLLDMNFSELLHARAEKLIHVPAQEDLLEARHTSHTDNQMLKSEHSIFSYSPWSI